MLQTLSGGTPVGRQLNHARPRAPKTGNRVDGLALEIFDFFHGLLAEPGCLPCFWNRFGPHDDARVSRRDLTDGLASSDQRLYSRAKCTRRRMLVREHDQVG